MEESHDTAAAAVAPISISKELEIQIKRAEKEHGIGTSFKGLDDECLQGHGFTSGRVSCISGDKETGKSTIALYLMANKLLDSQDGQVCLIDTTGTFDVFRLHQIVVSRLAGMRAGRQHEDTDNSHEADEALQRLRIMRVFDFDGLADALEEIDHNIRPAQTAMMGKAGQGKMQRQHKRKARGKEASEIPDSEEDEPLTSSESDEDEMQQCSTVASSLAVEMLVVDNLTTIVNPMLKGNHVQAQAQLTSYLRSLAKLSRQYNIVTLLVNGISHPPRPAITQTTAMQHDAMAQMGAAAGPNRARTWDSVSIFAANDCRPALGKSFLHFVDLHILLSLAPKSIRDVNISYDGNNHGTGQRPDLVHVAEVISDRYDGQVGRWTAFRIDRGIELVAAI